ncbi:hypothetical protein LENED_011885 [Lentinula edodes]|uniref:Uncharacterized protein n=1 Tax=Lentinula edodes TaxID=5353 RepID=A0A1Q3ER73_LENED|nr:hypothetical protein LENED_011885 [Lentinula edodes]
MLDRCKDELQAQIQILEGPNLEVWSSLVLLHSSTYVQKFVSLTMNRGFHQQFKDDESQYCIIVQGPDPVSEDLLSVHSHDPRAEDCLLCPVNNVQEASAEYLTIVTQNFLGSELTNSDFTAKHNLINHMHSHDGDLGKIVCPNLFLCLTSFNIPILAYTRLYICFTGIIRPRKSDAHLHSGIHTGQW